MQNNMNPAVPPQPRNPGQRRRPQQPQRRVFQEHGESQGDMDSSQVKAEDVMSRALRKQRALLGLEAPFMGSISNGKARNVIDEDRAPTSKLPNVGGRGKLRTPAFLAVPTLSDKLSLNLLRLAEKQKMEQGQLEVLQEQSQRGSVNSRDVENVVRQDSQSNGLAKNSRGGKKVSRNRKLLKNRQRAGQLAINSTMAKYSYPHVEQTDRSRIPSEAGAGGSHASSQIKAQSYFSAKINANVVKNVGGSVLRDLHEVLDRHDYRPNEHFDSAPPPEVTRACFDALDRLTGTLSGPIQKLLSNASQAIRKSAFVDDEYRKSRLVPKGIGVGRAPVFTGKIESIPSDITSSPDPNSNLDTGEEDTSISSKLKFHVLTESNSDNEERPSGLSSSSLYSGKGLLYTEANIFLQQALKTASLQLNGWKKRAAEAEAQREKVRIQVEELSRAESHMRAEVSATSRQEGSIRLERDELKAKDAKLQNELRNAKAMMQNAVGNEEELSAKNAQLMEELHEARDKLAVAEERLRTVQMTQDSNLVPRTEVTEARAKVVSLKKKFEEYKNVHALLEERCMKEADEHAKVAADLELALKERDALRLEHQKLQRTFTPRPDWQRIMDVCPELRRKVHERKFDVITGAKSHDHKSKRRTRSARTILTDGEGGNNSSSRLLQLSNGAGSSKSQLAPDNDSSSGIEQSSQNASTNLVAPTPVVGAPSSLTLRKVGQKTSDDSLVSSVRKPTRNQIPRRKGHKANDQEDRPVLPQAKKLGKTIGAEPKSAFRSVYTMPEAERMSLAIAKEVANNTGVKVSNNVRVTSSSSRSPGKRRQEKSSALHVESLEDRIAKEEKLSNKAKTESNTLEVPTLNLAHQIASGKPNAMPTLSPGLTSLSLQNHEDERSVESRIVTTSDSKDFSSPSDVKMHNKGNGKDHSRPDQSKSIDEVAPISTLQYTQDLCEILEANRLGQKTTMELEGVLRELGVVELKKILQDTQRHISETDRMIEDLRRTDESIDSSSTHKALIGGERHTILEGEFFMGVGDHPQVPRYLRASGRIRKRGIQKGELWNLTDRVWKARIKQRKRWKQYQHEKKQKADASAAQARKKSTVSTLKHSTASSQRQANAIISDKVIEPEETFAEFFYNFLFKRHKSHDLVVEWGYNIMAGLEVYMWDAHLELFLLTLTGAVTEDTFDDQLMLMSDLRAFFIKIDLTDCKRRQQYEPTGIIQLDDAVENLRAFFPNKRPEFFDKIADALAGCVDTRILGSSKRSRPIEYDKLFATSNLGTQGDFIEEIRDQHLREVRETGLRLEVEVAKHVDGHTHKTREKKKADLKSLDHKRSESKINRHGEIMVLALREIMKEIDPSAPPHVIDAYLAYGLGVDEKDVRWDSHADPDLFLRRMRTRLYRPYRCWMPEAKVKLVHWKRVLEAEQAELRAAGSAFSGKM